MFATLVGPYPHIDGSPHDRLTATITDQLDAGLGMLTDGRVHRVDPDAGDVGTVVDAWRAADAVGHHLAAVAGLEPPLIKACLMGAWTLGAGDATRARAAAARLVLATRALFEAGAPVVQVTEPGVGDIDPDDDAALDLLEEVLATTTSDVVGHLSLALAGGGPTRVPQERLFVAPFGSYLFDVIRSPDDWQLCVQVPGASGLIVGVGDSRTPDPDTEAVSIWGGRYAASMGGRGSGRVGLSMSSGLESLPRDVARAKLMALAEAGRLADLPDAELVRVIDPRVIDARSAALGRYEPPAGRQSPSG